MKKVVKAYVLEPATVNVATMPSDAVLLNILPTPGGVTMYAFETHPSLVMDRKFLVVPTDVGINPEWDVRYVGSAVADGHEPIHVFEVLRGLVMS